MKKVKEKRTKYIFIKKLYLVDYSENYLGGDQSVLACGYETVGDSNISKGNYNWERSFFVWYITKVLFTIFSKIKNV